MKSLFLIPTFSLLAVLAFGADAKSDASPNPAVKAAIEKVDAAGASLLPIAAGVEEYRFTALNVAKEFKDAGLAPLAPIAEKITSLDLARTGVTDAGLKAVAAMKNLKELRLDNTGISDAGLDHLKGLSNLEYLNLYGSKVTDAGVMKLAALPKLKSLYLWQTGVTKKGFAQLKGKMPNTHINMGWGPEDDAKPVAAVAAAKPAAETKPAAKPAANPATAAPVSAELAAKIVVYKDLIAPVLEAKCVACHSEEKTKGKLKMHTFADLMKGGSEGKAVVAKNTKDSLMLVRARLPLDDDEHMPPEDEEQLTVQELAVLDWWVAEGAPEKATLAQMKQSDAVKGAIAALVAANPPKVAGAAPQAAAGGLDPALAKQAKVYQHVVAPILEAKCVACHGEDKSKGKLKMHTYKDLLAGGSEGDVTLIPGKVKDSLMFVRMDLPLDDDEHMPPEDEEQLTSEEVAILKWWVEQGASETVSVADAKKTPEIEKMLAAVLSSGLPKVAAKETAKEKPAVPAMTDAEKKALADVTAKLAAMNATLMPIAQDTELLRLSVINAADKFGDKELALLAPVAKHVVWVDLARSKVTDAAMATAAAMPNLERLHLENTGITDAGVAKLAGLKRLEYLNLYGTKVTDAGIAKLATVTGLKKLFVWQTGVTKAGAKALEGKIAGLTVNVGLSEAEIAKLTAPPPEPPKKEEPKSAPAKKPEPKKEEPKKADTPPAKKPEPKKADTPPAKKPEPKKADTPPAKAAPKPAAKPAAAPAKKPETKPQPKKN